MPNTLWVGRRQSVGIGLETTRGVGVSPAYWLNALSFSFSDKPVRARSEASFGGIWGGDQSPVVFTPAEGEFDVELGDQSFGAILVALLGSISSASNGDDSYTHTYTLQNDNQHDSLSITTIDPIGNFIYELAMINSLELTIEPDSLIHYTVNFISKGSTDTAGQSASFGAERKFVGRMLQFKLASLTSGLAAASKINLKSLTLRFEKNAEANQTLSTIQPEDVVNKLFSISGEITLDYSDRTYLNLVKEGTYQAVRVNLTHTDDAGSGNPYAFNIDLSKCDFEDFDPDFSLDEIVTQTVSFTALYDSGNNDNLFQNCTLTNQVASYL